ncbi:MAG: hypothetical protein ABSB29_08250 [Nitrososphaerales archaeon]|jgi:hypothetical protein
MIENPLLDFEKIVLKYHSIPPKMVKAASYFLLSSTVGRHLTVPDMPGKYPWPNVFFMTGSEPAITHRSTLHNLVEQVLQENFGIMNPKEETLDQTDEDGTSLQEKFFQHKIESSNVEGIADHVRTTDFDYYLVLSGEYGYTMAQAMKPGSYTFGIPSIFAKMYYGESWSQNLSKRGGKEGFRFIKEGIFFNMFVSMQNLELYLTDLLLKQGFLRRTCLIPIENKELDVSGYKPYLSKDRPRIRKDLSEFADRLSVLEKEIVKGQVEREDEGVVSLSDEVINEVNKYDRENYARSINQAKQNEGSESNPWYQYAISRAEYLLKFTVLETVAEGKRVSELKHLDRARDFLGSVEPAQRRVITLIGYGSSERKEDFFPTAELPQRQVLEYAIRNYEGFFKFADVKAILNTTVGGKVSQLIDLLEAKGYVKEVVPRYTKEEDAKKILPPKVFERVRPEAGFFPSVYQATAKGRKLVSNE